MSSIRDQETFAPIRIGSKEAPGAPMDIGQDPSEEETERPGGTSPKKRSRPDYPPSGRHKKHKHKGKGSSGSFRSSKSAKSKEGGKSLDAGDLAMGVADQAEESLNYQMLKEVTVWWKEARKELKNDHHKTEELRVERFVPKWNILADSTVLYREAGQASWEIYSNTILPRDQASILMTSHTRIEEHIAHALMQIQSYGYKIW
ncbi:UNVERIFIED_CONTAM: hypothetical protein Sindi_2887400 [Sesamum indicum]